MQNSEVIPSTRRYRYYDLLLVAFVTVLLCSNLIGAGKAATITLPWLGEVTYGAGILFFPISYLFGDILTEVYGYAHDRRAVWAGFAALSFAAVMSLVVVSLTPAQNAYMQEYQHGLETVFGNTWRIVIASITAFWAGSLANGYVMAKLKIRTAGKYLWMRTIGSTAVGEAIDSSLFYMLAFYAIWPIEQVIAVAIAQYFLKTGWEVIMTPVTYKVVAWLKNKEQEDYFDNNTNFTPFHVSL